MFLDTSQAYKMDKAQTSLEEMKNGYKMLNKYLDNVYLGNLTQDEYEYCTTK